MIMDKLFMQGYGRQVDGLHGVYGDIGDGGIRIAGCPFKGEGPCSGRYIPELVLSAPEGDGIDRVCSVDAHDQCAGAVGQHTTLDFGGHHVVEYGEVGLQQEFAIPEEDRPGEIEVQPKFEFVVGDVLHIRS